MCVCVCIWALGEGGSQSLISHTISVDVKHHRIEGGEGVGGWGVGESPSARCHLLQSSSTLEFIKFQYLTFLCGMVHVSIHSIIMNE